MTMASCHHHHHGHNGDVVGFLEYEFIKNKKFIIVPSKTWYSQHMNNTGTCPDIDSQIPQLTKSREFIRELTLLAIMHGHGPVAMGMGRAWMMELGRFHTKLALISDRHLSPPTLCIYPALATHHGICNRHEPGAWHISEKVNLPRELKMNSPC